MPEPIYKYIWSNGESTVEQLFSLSQIENGSPSKLSEEIGEHYLLVGRCIFSGISTAMGHQIFERDIVRSEYIIPDEPVEMSGVVKYSYRLGRFVVEEEGGEEVPLNEFNSFYVVGNSLAQPNLLEELNLGA